MRSRDLRHIAALLLVAVATTAVAAPSAEAGGKKHGSRYNVYDSHPGKGRKHWKNSSRHHRVRYVVVRQPRQVVYRPVSPDWFYWQRPRFVVVRPVPVWVGSYGGSGLAARIGVHGGDVSFDLAFSNRSPAYGCGFCGTNFTQYGSWESHVHGCNQGPGGPIVCERWGDDDLSDYRAQARDQWNEEYGRRNHDDRYEYRDG